MQKTSDINVVETRALPTPAPLLAQIAAGNQSLMDAMIESNLGAGHQAFRTGCATAFPSPTRASTGRRPRPWRAKPTPP